MVNKQDLVCEVNQIYAVISIRFPRWASNLSQPARDLLENLLNVDPKFRFTAAKAEKHPWVTGKSVLPNNYLASPGKIGDVRIDLREPVSPTMKAMHDRLQEANGVKTTAESKGIVIFLYHKMPQANLRLHMSREEERCERYRAHQEKEFLKDIYVCCCLRTAVASLHFLSFE